MRGTGGRYDFKPQITPDPMIQMHHQIARRQGLRLSQEILSLAAFLWRADQPVAQHVLFGNHRQPRRFKPVFQRPNRQMQPAFSNPCAVGDRDRLGQSFVFDQSRQTFACALGI